MSRLHVVTGATGLLGSHVVEVLVARGERVRAIVRSTSDTTHLSGLGVELAIGDLSDPASLPSVLDKADVVYHCAAHVGDWGPWSLFQERIVDTTCNLVDACAKVSVGRLLHVSSIAAYGHPRIGSDSGEFNEDQPLGQNHWWWDHYSRAKVAAERKARTFPGAWTVVRPSWIYGPRDRATLPRVLKALRAGRVAMIGPGDNLLNIVFAGDVAEGCVLAAENPSAVGRAYNLSSEGEITQRDFLGLMTSALNLPPIRRRLPFWFAFRGAFLAEMIGRAIFLKRPPHFTRTAVALIGRPTLFSVKRSRTELGWRPQVPIAEGLRRTLAWYWGLHPEMRPETAKAVS